jgi:hypothetical protein
MSLLAKPRRLIVLALPLVVLLAMMIRSELILARGREFEVSIDGYDPRDLLRGQFLRYRVRWNRSGGESGECPGCCLCLQRDIGTVDPQVLGMQCNSVEGCAAFIKPEALDGLGQYYIPEGMGPPLERAIRERRASLRIAVGHAGDVVVRDLLLDGKPWRDVISR